MSDNRTFVVLDGPDFSGKSTLMEAFLKRVADKGIDHVALREPGGTPGSGSVAEELRELLIANREEKIHPEVDVMLHMAYRAQNVRDIIIPGLVAGKWVISDRFLFSTWCLNVQAHLDTHPHLADLMKGLMPYAIPNIPEPMTFILDTPREIRDARANSNVRKKDRYESQPKAVLDRIDAAYEQLRSVPSCKFIDGTLPLEEQVDIMFAYIEGFKEQVLKQMEEVQERAGLMDDERAQAVDVVEQMREELNADETWNLDEKVAEYVRVNVTEMADQLFQGASEDEKATALTFAEKFADNMARTVFSRTNGDRTVFHPTRVGQINQKVHSMISWGFARDSWAKHFANGGDNATDQTNQG